MGSTKAADGTKLGTTAFGGYHQPAPCRTYDKESGVWVDSQVLYANHGGNGAARLDRDEASRLKVHHDVFVMRGNTGERIREQEHAAFQERMSAQSPGVCKMTKGVPATQLMHHLLEAEPHFLDWRFSNTVQQQQTAANLTGVTHISQLFPCDVACRTL
jgi:hypothetical protein